MLEIFETNKEKPLPFTLCYIFSLSKVKICQVLEKFFKMMKYYDEVIDTSGNLFSIMLTL